MSENRRSHVRVRPSGVLKLEYGETGKFITAFCEDLSLGGLRLGSKKPLAVGSDLALRIGVGGGRTFDVGARVVWCKAIKEGQKYAIGLQFIELEDRIKNWIRNEVAERRKEAETAAAARGHQKRAAAGADSLAAHDDLEVSFDTTEPIIGIDLGTSNCCAFVIRDGKDEIIPLDESTSTLPSIVAFRNNETMVGQQAGANLSSNPKNTIFGSKRFIGLDYESPQCQSMLGRFPYRIVPDSSGEIAVETDSGTRSLTSVSALLLRHIAQRASAKLGGKISKAIVTVPAFYNDNQRQAVVAAGREAGLDVLRIVNEPTAAAIAYGLQDAKPRRVLVYDLGGGTFDVSVMSIHKDSLIVRATAGDVFLGGEDFDNILADLAIQKHREKTQEVLSSNASARAVIKEAAERAKRSLSSRDQAMVTVRTALLTNGNTTRVEVEISREEFESAARPLIRRTLDICDEALKEAGLNPADIKDIVLVGGQTRMPAVRSALEKHYHVKPRADFNPDEVVALGAAKLGALGTAGQRSFRDVLSMTIGVSIDHEFRPIIPKNTPVPALKSIRMEISQADWSSRRLSVYQGESKQVHQNEFLGDVCFWQVEPGFEDPIPVDVSLALTADCLLRVRLTNLVTQTSEFLVLSTRDRQ